MLKTLGTHIRGVVKESVLTPVCMIGEVIMEMVIPMLMASIINDGVEKGNLRHIYLVGSLMVLAWGSPSAWAAACSAPGPPRVLPETFGGPCTRGYRLSVLPTLTGSARRVW